MAGAREISKERVSKAPSKEYDVGMLSKLASLLVERSLGEIAQCLVVSEDGVVLYAMSKDENSEVLGAISSTLFVAVQTAMRDYLNLNIEFIDVSLEGRHFIIFGHGGAIFALLTRENPNLGLIYYLVEQLRSGTLS